MIRESMVCGSAQRDRTRRFGAAVWSGHAATSSFMSIGNAGVKWSWIISVA
jgi:hypothetical protein